MDQQTNIAQFREISDESLSDEDLSSCSLLKTLVQKSETDVTFGKLSIKEKIEQLPNQIKSSYFQQRESMNSDVSYNKDIEEYMRRTIMDRRKSLKDYTIPKYSIIDEGLKSAFSRPDLSEIRIPLMTKLSKPFEIKSSYLKNSRTSSTYVGKLLSAYQSNTTRPRRVSTIRLQQYKLKIKEEEDEGNLIIKDVPKLSEEYTPQEKKIIDKVLGDIPFREKSVYVPYGKLSYQRESQDSKTEEPNVIFTPSIGEIKLPSYDESMRPSKDEYKSRSFIYKDKNLGVGSVMWERTPSTYEFTLDPNNKRASVSSRKNKSVKFEE